VRLKPNKLKKNTLLPSLSSIVALFGVMMAILSSLKGAIVVNGDFEQGIVPDVISTAPLTNWTPTNSLDGTTQVFGMDTTLTYGIAPQSGSIAVAFTSDASAPANSMASISQTITTSPTKTYNLHFWISSPVADVNSRQNLFSVIWGGTMLNLSYWNPNFAAPNPSRTDLVELNGAAGTYVVAGDTAWFPVDILNLTPSPGSTTDLMFSGQNNNWATLVDNVLVEETPEPSTMVMIAAGAAVMGLRRKRQQRSA